MTPEIILDLSRLLSRVFHSTPTGIDRVEMAYAQGLLARCGPNLAFAVVHRGRVYGRVSRGAALAFLTFTAERWASDKTESRPRRWYRGVYWMARLHLMPIPRKTRPRVLIQASPHHLHHAALVERILRREGARWIVLVHDLIPITHPEFARPDGDQRHRRRMETVGRYATAVIANSEQTARQLKSFLQAPTPIVRVAHLGIFTPPPIGPKPQAARDPQPYFLVVGTIEPRKNHLLLLNIWRRLAEEHGPANIPQLVLVGRRGWENENVVDMLERSALLQDCVCELQQVSDRQLGALLAGCRALLMPSFAEGFGMPLTEALQLGIPAIVSDLPVLREIGQNIPEFIDPIDGAGWMRAILEYAKPLSVDRAAQLERLPKWRAPTWDAHLDIVQQLASTVQS